MKVFAAILLLLCCVPSAPAAERVVVYAMLLQKTDVNLSIGIHWSLEKGDCFPVLAYKDAHSKVILQLAGTQFMVNVNSTTEVGPNESPIALKKYRKNLAVYIEDYAQRWRAAAERAAAAAEQATAEDPGN